MHTIIPSNCLLIMVAMKICCIKILIVYVGIIFCSMVSDCDHKAFVFEDFGKEFVKSLKISPDSFIQVAIQLAYYKWVKWWNYLTYVRPFWIEYMDT